jgi:hypothetical protein
LKLASTAGRMEQIGNLEPFLNLTDALPNYRMSVSGPGCVKTCPQPRMTRICFLNCLLSIEAVGFCIDVIEMEILHASQASEFPHSLGQKAK